LRIAFSRASLRRGPRHGCARQMGGGAMEPDQKKEWIRTVALAALFLVLALLFLHEVMGDPMKMP